MRFHPHVVVGYSMYKIEAAAQFFAFAVRLLHLPHGFYIYRAAFTFAVRLLHFAARLLNTGAGDPSRPP